MTVRNDATGMVSVVKESLQTKSFRVALLAAFVSQTPLADGVWKTVGLESLSVKIEKIIAHQVESDKKIETVATKVDEVHNDLERLSNRVTGFEVDFNKYKLSHP